MKREGYGGRSQNDLNCGLQREGPAAGLCAVNAELEDLGLTVGWEGRAPWSGE